MFLVNKCSSSFSFFFGQKQQNNVLKKASSTSFSLEFVRHRILSSKQPPTSTVVEAQKCMTAVYDIRTLALQFLWRVEQQGDMVTSRSSKIRRRSKI